MTAKIRPIALPRGELTDPCAHEAPGGTAFDFQCIDCRREQECGRLVRARMAHYGYEPEQIERALQPIDHKAAGCKWEPIGASRRHFQWDCSDGRHPIAQEQAQGDAEFISWVLDNQAGETAKATAGWFDALASKAKVQAEAAEDVAVYMSRIEELQSVVAKLEQSEEMARQMLQQYQQRVERVRNALLEAE